MSDRRRREADQLVMSDDGRNIMGSDEQLIQNCSEFFRQRYSSLEHQNPQIADSSLWMIELPEDVDVPSARDAFTDWKDWYGSDARQAISQFEQMRREFDAEHSTKPGVLCISTSAKYDFRKCEPQHWEAEGWEINETLTDPIMYGSDEEMLQSLSEIFRRQGIAKIRVLESGSMCIVPYSDSDDQSVE